MSDDEQHFHPPGLTFMLDISAARWVEQGLGQNFAHVAALIPRGFARYARLFHPARNQHGERVRWAEVATWNGRTVHPLMAFERISGTLWEGGVTRSRSMSVAGPWLKCSWPRISSSLRRRTRAISRGNF